MTHAFQPAGRSEPTVDGLLASLTLEETPPVVDRDRLHAYRLGRIRDEMAKRAVALTVVVSPISLRYAFDYRNYGAFQSHIPLTYAFIPAEGPVVAFGAYGWDHKADDKRPSRAISFFEAGDGFDDPARLFAQDVVDFLSETGTDSRRVAVEYVNPSLTQALLQRGLEVLDGVAVIEQARVIKSEDEIACMRWAVAVAQHGIDRMCAVMRPGVSELQLWSVLTATNIANDGEWTEGRMLASGPRINPWLQEASPRRIEAGDLVGFDTDMIGPFGYFADVSRTVFCGPGKPTKRQKQLYREALAEIDHNLALVKPGITLSEFQDRAYVPPEEFHANRYPVRVHAVGMCDEWPTIFHAPDAHKLITDAPIEPGMVLCVESYVGAVGERDGVKLEQQVLVTETGYDILSTYPFDEALLG
jgi:Xaa-Pro dipeptidase